MSSECGVQVAAATVMECGALRTSQPVRIQDVRISLSRPNSRSRNAGK